MELEYRVGARVWLIVSSIAGKLVCTQLNTYDMYTFTMFKHKCLNACTKNNLCLNICTIYFCV
jgi:hypothetical protein